MNLLTDIINNFVRNKSPVPLFILPFNSKNAFFFFRFIADISKFRDDLMKPNVNEDDLKTGFDTITDACLRDNSAKKSELMNAMKFVLLWKLISTIELYAYSNLIEHFESKLAVAMIEHVKALDAIVECADIKKFIKILS